jgi:hypothetical protein
MSHIKLPHNSLGYFWYVYKTKCAINNKVYVGVHKAKKIPNSYIGCGVISDVSAKRRALKIKSPFVQAVAKYGYKNFNKEILEIFNNANDAYNMEARIVNEEWIKSGNSYNVSLGGATACKPSKYSHLFGEWKSLYESGMTMKEIAKRTGLSSHAAISINLENIVTKRKKYIIANNARKMKLFCLELGKQYDSQKNFLLQTFGECRSRGNLSAAIKNGLKFRGLTLVRVQ